MAVFVFQYVAVCSVSTVNSKKKNALACVMSATLVLSVQVSAVYLSTGMSHTSQLVFILRQIGFKIRKHTKTHTLRNICLLLYPYSDFQVGQFYISIA